MPTARKQTTRTRKPKRRRIAAAGLDGKPLDDRGARRHVGGSGWRPMISYDLDEFSRSRIRMEVSDAPRPGTVHRYEHHETRPTKEVMQRAKQGKRPRPRDGWDFVFEGEGEAVELVVACFYGAMARFLDSNDRWIALHYLARCSPPLIRCARGDAPEGAPLPRLLDVSDEIAAARLARALKIRDRAHVRDIVSQTRAMRDELARHGREHFHRAMLGPVFRLLGLPEPRPETEN